MDKLTAIKIKHDDGTYSDEIPISVLSENVEWDSTHTLVDILGSIDVDVTGTIQDQINQLFNNREAAFNSLADSLATPRFRAADATSKAILKRALEVDAEIVVPSSYTSQFGPLYDLEPRTWFCWMNGTEMEFARLAISVNTSNSVITLYLRGRTSIATGIMGVDSSWTVTQYASDAEVTEPTGE